MFYRKNLPGWERRLRIGLSIVFAFIFVRLIDNHWGWLLAAVALIMGLTGLVGFCPACALAGRRLNKDRQSAKQ